ncbi:conserved hypothetical protein [Trichinella spiralis]|uniref:hypothetical protein n=1 Tax=Trichinella spiralis TaxID=6334 RepID=UPI0001EFE0B8|nr:conserved hypothetical protein [Trichinella spiralis]
MNGIQPTMSYYISMHQLVALCSFRHYTKSISIWRILKTKSRSEEEEEEEEAKRFIHRWFQLNLLLITKCDMTSDNFPTVAFIHSFILKIHPWTGSGKKTYSTQRSPSDHKKTY